MNEQFRSFSFGKLIYLLDKCQQSLGKTSNRRNIYKNIVLFEPKQQNCTSKSDTEAPKKSKKVDDGSLSSYINGKHKLNNIKKSVAKNFEFNEYWRFFIYYEGEKESENPEKSYWALYNDLNVKYLVDIILSIFADSLIPNDKKLELCLILNPYHKLSFDNMISSSNIYNIFRNNFTDDISNSRYIRQEKSLHRQNFFKLALNIATDINLIETTSISLIEAPTYAPLYGEPPVKIKNSRKDSSYNYILYITKEHLLRQAEKWFKEKSGFEIPDDHELYKIKSYFVSENNTILWQQTQIEKLQTSLYKNRIVFIHGIGGIGKTSFVNKFLEIYQQKYQSVIYSVFENSLQNMIIKDDNIRIQGVRRISSDGKSESDEDYANRKLNILQEISERDVLWVIDNFDKIDDPMLNNVINGPYTILITTRIDFADSGYKQIDIDPLDDKMIMQLFLNHYGLKVSNKERSEIKKIFSLVNKHTLTVELIAKLMKNNNISASEMYKMLKEEGISPNIQGVVKHGLNESGTIYQIISKLFKLDTLSDEEHIIMINMTLLPIKGIDSQQFLELCGYKNRYDIINNLVDRSWLKNSNDKQRIISIHPVIREIVWNECSVKADTVEIFLNNLGKKSHDTWGKDYTIKIEVAELARNVLEKLDLNDIKYFFIILSFLEAFVNANLYDMVLKCLDMMKNLATNPTSKEKAAYLFRLGDYHLHQIEYDKAIDELKESKRILSRIMPESFEYAYVSKHLAHTYHFKYEKDNGGKECLDNAKSALIESKIICNMFDNDHPQVASQYYAEALNAYYYGDFDTAIDKAEKSLNMFENLNGKDHTDNTSPMRVIALVKSKQGYLAEAVKIENNIIRIRKKQWNNNQYQYFEQLETLAKIYIENKVYDKGINELYNILNMIPENTKYFEKYTNHIKTLIKKYESEKQA